MVLLLRVLRRRQLLLLVLPRVGAVPLRMGRVSRGHGHGHVVLAAPTRQRRCCTPRSAARACRLHRRLIQVPIGDVAGVAARHHVGRHATAVVVDMHYGRAVVGWWLGPGVTMGATGCWLVPPPAFWGLLFFSPW